jgi:peptidoglycan/xylan/chitin deacetylase (PgdA/CDA1 family)
MVSGWVMRVSRKVAKLVHFVNERTIGFDIDNLRGVVSRFPNAEKQICLTFDDGPSGYSTAEILDCLDKYEIRATFFCTGQNAQKHPDLLRYLIRQGHEVGSHSMTHPNFHVSPISVVYREMRNSRRVLEQIGGCRVVSFRAPYGSFSWEVRPIGKVVGTPHLIGWDVAPQHDVTDPISMADVIVKETSSGSVINLHDGLADQGPELSADVSRAAAECVHLVVPMLLEKGFRFRTVSEQLHYIH